MSAPAVAVSSDGKLFAAAWKDMRTGEPNIFWSWSATPELGKESLLHSELSGVQDHPSLVIDSSNTVWAAWEDNRGGAKRVWLRSSHESDGGRPVTELSEAPASYPSLATGGGLVVVAYESAALGKKIVVVRRVTELQE